MAETGVDYAQIWQQTLGTLHSVGLSNQERAFVRLCRLVGVLDQTALVRAPNTFTKDFLEQRVREQIHNALASQLGHPVQLAVSVDESLETDLGMISDEPSGQASVHGGSRGGPSGGMGGHQNGSGGYGSNAHNPLRDLAESAPALNGADLDEPHQPAYPGGQTRMELGPDPLSGGESGPLRLQQRVEPSSPGDTRLNPKYTFDTFVIGASNRFAHAAAVAVAEAPGRRTTRSSSTASPGWARRTCCTRSGTTRASSYPTSRVRYVNSEEFTNDFINSIRDDKAQRVPEPLPRASTCCSSTTSSSSQGKLQTQEEFFHTFNTLHNANKQIVITSDLPPSSCRASRTGCAPASSGACITDIQPPDLETRIAILRKKADPGRMSLPDDVLEYIASRSQTNIRELEGALIRVTAFANLNRQAGRPGARRDRAQGPHPQREAEPDHRRDDHGAHGRRTSA